MYIVKCLLQVKLSVFISYCKSLGLVLAVLLLLFFLLYQLASVASSVWLSQWTEDKILKNGSLINSTVYQKRQNLFLGIYGGLGAAQGKQ